MAGKSHWLQDAVNPAHKGDCTPMTKKTCTGHKRQFAEEAKAGDFKPGHKHKKRMEDRPSTYAGRGR